MRSTNHPQGIQQPTAQTTAGGEARSYARKWYRIEYIVWLLALLVFVVVCFIVHSHPKPYPVDLSVTQTIQHMQLPAFLMALVVFPSIMNNPVPSEIALGIWLVGLLVLALIAKLRHKSPLTWLQSAFFLIVTVMSSAGLNVLADDLVARPRPNPHTEPVHVAGSLVPFPTFPSGHTEHDMAYYGFLLYLSFTRPVREWRYRWFLLPFQIYAVYDILFIGYSRILEGDHWFTDVLGGYLEGAIYLFFFIFLYRLTTVWLAQWRAKHRIRTAIAS
ncbi:phosphatase PAP2 family protein [Dictyobacter arantiisoli]|uniref:Phosphatidic acid phosphatase type 2/haloperoxidase domain-containing protein n=1 Tax=Dictyobacter arantiisoli TaxID=2014874 RepID=A0A5A5TD62_9CHLR|nr:phosphatase PAP2 family protein [Dictyobacter arantiisoli]GCF09402.1 hypothetical protein KDI_29660 [Dictyobacter arantiisoli]